MGLPFMGANCIGLSLSSHIWNKRVLALHRGGPAP